MSWVQVPSSALIFKDSSFSFFLLSKISVDLCKIGSVWVYWKYHDPLFMIYAAHSKLKHNYERSVIKLLTAQLSKALFNGLSYILYAIGNRIAD